MGTIRLLLALAVVLFHSYGFIDHWETMTGGAVSVEAFYIISGFYMAMILAEKYRPGPGAYRLFITNRFLRIFPPYWAFLFLVLLTCLAGKIFWNEPLYLWYWETQWGNLDGLTIVLLIFANLFLFGSDWLLFSGVDPESGLLKASSNAFTYHPMAFQYLLIPQIWSVGVELSFYLLAPLLLRARWFWQAGVLLLSLGLRFYLYHSEGWNYDPWTYRFFPNELAFFLAGSLAYRFYSRLREKKIPRFFPVLCWGGVAALILFYPHFTTLPGMTRRWYFYAIFLAALPFIFLASKNLKWDRLLGELSFPVYICHHLVMFLWRKYFFTHTMYMSWFGIITAASSLVLAFLLWRTVMVPVERLRRRRFEKKAALT